MSQGLSIANNLLAGAVKLNLDRNQAQLKGTVTALSSGLRITSAADDPSGLAIATNLETQAAGFTTAVQNVQNANNAAQVALGAITTTTDILRRIRSLAVEAASDIESQGDRANLQTEVSQLLLEINRISQNTNYNGQPLLDGSHAGFQPQTDASVAVTANTVLANGGPVVVGGSSGIVSNGDFSQPPVALNSLSFTPPVPNWSISGFYIIYNGNDGGDPVTPPGQQAAGIVGGSTATTTVTGLVVGQQYQIQFQAAQQGGTTLSVSENGNNITPAAIGSLGGAFAQYTTQTFTATATTASLDFTAAGGGAAYFTDVIAQGVSTTPVTINGNLLVASVNSANANFNTTVGTSLAWNSLGTYATVDGTIALQVINTGVSIAVQETFINSATGLVCVDPILYGGGQTSSDFDNVAITIGTISAQDVGTSAYIKVRQNVAALTNPNAPAFNFQSGANEGDVIQVGIGATNTQTLRVSNVNVAISAANNPSLGAEDAIGQIDTALDILLHQQSELGAVVVRLNEDANSDSIAAVNLRASESSLRDVNVGQATTEFTKLQILVQVGTSVLAQSNSNAQTVLALLR